PDMLVLVTATYGMNRLEPPAEHTTPEAVAASRDDFPPRVKTAIAARVAYRCSRPDCRAQTTGPQDDPHKSVSVGVAAHITAASMGGPRYDASLTSGERRHPRNGIWLCQNCAKLVDNDESRFTVEILRKWKADTEREARALVGKTAPGSRHRPRGDAA